LFNIAYERLVKYLAKYGCSSDHHTHGLWTCKDHPILFSIAIDDFGVKTVGQRHANHLTSTLRDLYSVTDDWTGTKYLGLKLKCDYHVYWTCDISMPDYVVNILHRFQHPFPKRLEHSPHTWLKPNCGATIQILPLLDTTAKLSPSSITQIQQVISMLLYYALAVDSTMIVALGSSLPLKHKPSFVSPITLLPILMPASVTRPATWSCTSIVTPHTYLSPKPPGVLVDTSSSAINLRIRQNLPSHFPPTSGPSILSDPQKRDVLRY
jgi:hypothetical protein